MRRANAKNWYPLLCNCKCRGITIVQEDSGDAICSVPEKALPIDARYLMQMDEPGRNAYGNMLGLALILANYKQFQKLQEATVNNLERYRYRHVNFGLLHNLDTHAWEFKFHTSIFDELATVLRGAGSR